MSGPDRVSLRRRLGRRSPGTATSTRSSSTPRSTTSTASTRWRFCCARALEPDGLLYLDEYVGPSRDEWSLADELRLELALLPSAEERPSGRAHPPADQLRGSDRGVASSDILPAIAREFDTLEQRDYGGNLLSVIYGNLRRPDQRPTLAARRLRQGGRLPGGRGGVPPRCGRTVLPHRPPRSTEVGKQSHRACRPAE